MMSKKRWVRIILSGVLLFCFQTSVLAGEGTQDDHLTDQLIQNKESQEKKDEAVAAGGDILLVYPDETTEKIRQNVGFLADAATCLSKKMVFVSASEAEGYLSSYPYVICYSLTGKEEKLLQELLEYEGEACILGGEFLEAYFGFEEKERDVSGILEYSFSETDCFESSVVLESLPEIPEERESGRNGSIRLRNGTAAFFSKVDGTAYCPVTDFSSPLLKEAALQEIVFWQWPYLDQPPDYAQYLVLDQVYPFMPAEQLMDWVQTCIDNRIPFVMSVMPIYQNSEFPAMQQFCEVLKYAQSNGGAVILHAPLMHGESESEEEFRATVTRSIRAYTDRGVYPLGLAVPREWIWNQQKLEFMRLYRTVFVYETGEDEKFDLSVQTNLLQQNYHQLIMQAKSVDGTGMSYQSSYSSAVYVDVRQDMRNLENAIDHFRDSSIPLKSLWDMNHSVWADNFHLSCTDACIAINDEPQDVSYKPEKYPENYDYHRGTLKRITVSLKSQNQKLLIAGTAATVIFLIMIIRARILVIRYFRRRNELPEKKRFGADKKE